MKKKEKAGDKQGNFKRKNERKKNIGVHYANYLKIIQNMFEKLKTATLYMKNEKVRKMRPLLSYVNLGKNQ